VDSHCLTETSINAFRDCALQVLTLCARGLVKLHVLLWFEYLEKKLWLLNCVVLCFSWQDVYLGEYLGVNDDWMDVIASQGSSLLTVDVSGSNVTDSGLKLLKDCLNLQALTLNYCDQFSEHGLKHISGSYFLVTRFFNQNI
jgi:hypothetical protein